MQNELRLALERIVAATPENTNSRNAAEALSWTYSVAKTALCALSVPEAEPEIWQARDAKGAWVNCVNEETARYVAHLHDGEVRPLFASPQTAAVAVKGLEWVKKGSDWYVWSIVGQYGVGKIGDGYSAILRFVADDQDDDKVLIRDVGLEEAKAAAQADYERRIRSALIPSPQEVSEEMVERACQVYLSMEDGSLADVMRAALTAALSLQVKENGNG